MSLREPPAGRPRPALDLVQVARPTRRKPTTASSGTTVSGNRKAQLGRQDWIDAALAELLAGGVNAVKVDRLARRLRVTRGSFYWHFANRAELLRELLDAWETTNTRAFEQVLRRRDANGLKEFMAVVELWVEEREFSPAFDTAVRDWARVSKDARAAVRRVDDRRIEVLRRIFLDMGYADPEALVRARITYFHQIGYYTIALGEDPARRRALVPVYIRVLTGRGAPRSRRRP